MSPTVPVPHRSPVAIVLAVAVACALALGVRAPDAAAIVRGTELPVGTVPWMVQVDNGRYAQCTGSLIRPRVVLTAAHCVDVVGGLDRVVLGRQKASGPGGRPVPIVRAAFDPKWRRLGRQSGRDPRFHLVSDVGLVELATPVTDVVPVPLGGPAQASLLFPQQPALLAGWGEPNAAFTGPHSNDERILQVATVPVRSPRWCVAHLIARDGSSRGIACVGRTRKPIAGGCSGDSGGPLYRDTATGPVQLGVTSSIENGCGGGATLVTKVIAGTGRTFIDRHLAPDGTLRGGQEVRDGRLVDRGR